MQNRCQGMEGSFPGMSEGWEHGVVWRAAMVGRRTLWGEGLRVGVDEPICSGKAAAEQLPSLPAGTCCLFPSLLFALEAAESSAGICQERSLVLHFWRGGLRGEVEKYW